MDKFIKINSIERPYEEIIVNTSYVIYIKKQRKNLSNQFEYIVNVRGYDCILVSKEEYERLVGLLYADNTK